MSVARVTVAAALLAQLMAANGFLSSNQFVKNGRRLTKPEQAAAPGEPGLYLVKPSEDYKYSDNDESRGVPAKREISFVAVVYTDVGTDADAVPADLIDTLLDAIDAALQSGLDPGTFKQTLGGLVDDCRIEGRIEFSPGDSQGKGETIIPITVVLP